MIVSVGDGSVCGSDLGSSCGAGGADSSRISPQVLQLRSPGELACPLRHVGLDGIGAGGTGAGCGWPGGVTSTDDRSHPQLWPSTVPSQKYSVTGRSVWQFGQSLIMPGEPAWKEYACPRRC